MVTIQVQLLNKADGFVSQWILQGATAAHAFSQIFAIDDLIINEGDKFVFTEVNERPGGLIDRVRAAQKAVDELAERKTVAAAIHAKLVESVESRLRTEETAMVAAGLSPDSIERMKVHYQRMLDDLKKGE